MTRWVERAGRYVNSLPEFGCLRGGDVDFPRIPSAEAPDVALGSANATQLKKQTQSPKKCLSLVKKRVSVMPKSHVPVVVCRSRDPDKRRLTACYKRQPEANRRTPSARGSRLKATTDRAFRLCRPSKGRRTEEACLSSGRAIGTHPLPSDAIQNHHAFFACLNSMDRQRRITGSLSRLPACVDLRIADSLDTRRRLHRARAKAVCCPPKLVCRRAKPRPSLGMPDD